MATNSCDKGQCHPVFERRADLYNANFERFTAWSQSQKLLARIEAMAKTLTVRDHEPRCLCCSGKIKQHEIAKAYIDKDLLQILRHVPCG
jgi:hypothetical protein